MRREQRIGRSPRIRAKARPRVSPGECDHVCPHGIELDVAAAGKEIAAALHQARLEPPLPKRPGAIVPTVEQPCIIAPERMHQPRQGACFVWREQEVRVTVRAMGDFTSSIGELVAPGMPAVISSPQGHFDYKRGTEHQVWVAGGIGVLLPRVRRIAGWGLIALLVAVFPANVYAAVAHVPLFGLAPAWLWARLPFQLLFIAWVWWCCLAAE